MMLMLMIFTLSSVGLAISKHVCHSEGVVEFSLTGISSCSDHQNESDARTCCKKPIDQSTKKQGCCDEDFVYAVLDIAKKQEDNRNEKFYFAPVVTINFSRFSDSFASNDSTYNLIKETPPLLIFSVNNFLSLISVFRL
jgi:hypothetical protein